MIKKETRGGKRQGAGRPIAHPTKIISFRVQIEQVQIIKNIVNNYLKSIKPL
jgi:hypothetical protein